MAALRFTKMHGLGNDFVVIDAINQRIQITPELAQKLADRRFGIGCDQILVVERPVQAQVDFRYRIFNADGSEVEQCGNGARCFVRFVHDQGLSTKREIRVETKSSLITLRLNDDQTVTVNMGEPEFTPARIPFVSKTGALIEPLQVGTHTVQITAVSMGNPHAVQVVDNLDTAPVATQGPLIESHPQFPARVNAGFMQVIDPHNIRLRVFERGSGETLACGTGACAAAVAGIARGLLQSPVHVQTRGGALSIAWGGQGQPVMMSGPAQRVFDGVIEDLDVF